jgi:hypothetical protein
MRLVLSTCHPCPTTHSPRFAVDQVYDCCATYMANHPHCEVFHISAQLFLQLCRAMHGLQQRVGGFPWLATYMCGATWSPTLQ